MRGIHAAGLVTVLLLLAACSDGSGTGEGDIADAHEPTTTSASSTAAAATSGSDGDTGAAGGDSGSAGDGSDGSDDDGDNGDTTGSGAEGGVGGSGEVSGGAEVDPAFLESLEGYIVFTSERDDAGDSSSDDIYIMNADGSDVRRLTDTDHNDWWPGISADGSMMVLGRNYPGENRSPLSGHSAWGIFIWQQGDEPVDVTDNREFQSSPRLSPDGSRILFTSGRGSRAGFRDGLYQTGQTNLWMMDVDGSDAVQLTENGGASGSWSPDGSEIVCSAVAAGKETRDLFVMNADGTGIVQLTDDIGNNSRPVWSPDGSRIAFDSDRDGDREIFVMDADGSNVEQLTDNDARDDQASWSPAGDAIAFTSDRDGNVEIYVMGPDGSNQANVTNNGALDMYPSWADVPFQ